MRQRGAVTGLHHRPPAVAAPHALRPATFTARGKDKHSSGLMRFIPVMCGTGINL
jgi:hypothetical protein